ncbi:protein FAM210B, mitochondrial [Elgaria multicarinata webbii]|uniref:protein FAM210B, mitochondrial n=1 Tax=Elgaria multicarinata webbii TaxID=159646 RepID=UPI002FCD39BD
MLRLGQPCALHALLPNGLLQAASGSAPFREAAHSYLQAAGAPRAAAALRLLLSGQVPLSPAAEEKAPPRRRQPRGSPRLLHRRLSRESLLLLLLLPPSPGSFWFPEATAAAARRSQGEWRLLLLGPREAADPCQLRPELNLQTTGSHFPAGGGGGGGGGRERSSLGSQKDTSGSPENDQTDPSQENGNKLNKSQQLKKVFKEYGAVGVVFHVGISLMSLGMFYLAVSSGLDMTAILFKLGFDEALVQSKLAAGTSTFVLAYAIHKLFAPVRISITLVSVPLLVRYFRKIGFFKPPAPNP